MDDEQELEPLETTTGTGRLLFMFLGMVALCAIFFGLGYSLGHSSGPSTTQAAEPIPVAGNGAAKPSALNAGDSGAPPSGSQLTFYDAVEKKDSQPALSDKPATKDQAKPDAAKPKSEEARLAEAAGMTPVTSAPPAPGYSVQIAAVTRQEDADALLRALSKKRYAAFVLANGPDKFFHVQVGPFSDLKEAETMKARLVADGYKPIVKK